MPIPARWPTATPPSWAGICSPSRLGPCVPSWTRPIGGDEPQRLAALIARLCTPTGLAALLRDYPVLARLLTVASRNAADAGLELLTRFAADRVAVVAELLSGSDPGPVVAVEPGLGDRHRDGRTVAAIRFADGRS